MNHPENAHCLIDRSAIDEALDSLAEKLNEHMADKCPVVLTVLQGGLIFTGQLLPRLNFTLEQDYVHASRYHGTQSGSELRWHARPRTALQDRDVLLLDDIYDEGKTLYEIARYCRHQEAASVTTAVLLQKNHTGARSDLLPDFVALEVEDKYVFGFGMDLGQYWRNSNGIFVLPEEGEGA